MISLFKAIPFGILLTALLSTVIGTEYGTGGSLSIVELEIMGVEFFWSWLVLLGGTGLTWLVILMIGD